MLRRRLIGAAIIISVMIFLLWLDFLAGKLSMTGRHAVRLSSDIVHFFAAPISWLLWMLVKTAA